ncbi:MAG: hypothetical protein AB1426_05660 [Bacillota bacterium]
MPAIRIVEHRKRDVTLAIAGGVLVLTAVITTFVAIACHGSTARRLKPSGG